MSANINVGQIWEQKKTPRTGNLRLWRVSDIQHSNYYSSSGDVIANSKYRRISLKCVGSSEGRSIEAQTLLGNYKLRYENKTQQEPSNKNSLSKISQLAIEVAYVVERCAEQKVDEFLESVENEARELPGSLQEEYKDMVFSLLQDLM